MQVANQIPLPLTMEHARERGVLGMERSAARADRAHCKWTEQALDVLVEHVQSLPNGAEFIVEDVRLAIESKVPEPPDLRAWGAVTQAAIKRLYISRTGKYAPAKSSNASDKPLYRKGSAL